MDELLELFKGQLSYDHFEKFSYRELDMLKTARIKRFEREKEREEQRRKEANNTIR